MISPELERRIRDAVARWNRGEHRLDPEWTDPDVEIHAAAGAFAGTTYTGLEGVERWVADMSEAFDEWQLEVHELDEPVPGRVLGVGTVHLRGRGSGVDVDMPCAWLWDHVDGVLTRFEPFPNRVKEARAAAVSR
jgi:ketosteroid isomerase-like protein